MKYAIEMYEGGRSVGCELFSERFDAAKRHAIKAVVDKCAERVEVRDDRGNLHFHYPRIMRAI